MATRQYTAEDLAEELASAAIVPQHTNGTPRLLFGDIAMAWANGSNVQIEMKDGSVFALEIVAL